MNANNAVHTPETGSADRGADLQKTLELHRGERHIVVIQDYPDPDALSCAFVHRLISARFEITSDIVFGSRISHAQNVALAKLLGLPLAISSATLDLSVYAGSVFIDCQGGNSSLTAALQAAGIRPIILIDHHEKQEEAPQAEFVEIRHAGATATMYTQYIAAGLLDLDRNRREHVVAATALMHGIMTDTNQLIRASEEDFHAAAFLARFYDAGILMEIMSQARPKPVMDIIQRALQNRVLREGYCISGIGYLRSEDRDAIPQAADFLLTEENIHTAIVYGLVVSDRDGQRVENLIGSMRTIKLTIDPDTFIKEALGRNESGQFFGGGKAEAGGFEIAIGFLSGGTDEYQSLKWQVYDTQIKQRLFGKIGVQDTHTKSAP
jgi:nanoRNase/pAp phosphatase (c-di-AMP/oligoRNAs hydrolase)